jgi:uncharacterized membrane protein YhiD involved in acid resistance
MLRIILIFLVIYLVVRLAQSFSRDNSSQQKTYRNQFSRREEGEITVENLNSKNNKKVSNSDGEYINYEEL